MNIFSKQKYTKITQYQWEELNNFFVNIEPPAQNEMYASGDHYVLYMKLRDFGFRPKPDAMSVYRKAEQILANGWE